MLKAKIAKLSLSVLSVACLSSTSFAADADVGNLQASYNFLVGQNALGGALYTGTAGALSNELLPLSYYDTPDFWTNYVCKIAGNDCNVNDVFNSNDYTLAPPVSPSGDLQYERIDVHNGTDIYDAATWQIGVMLGYALNGFGNSTGVDAYDLAQSQDLLLQYGYDGNAPPPADGQWKPVNRGVTNGDTFVYNGNSITTPKNAYYYRMVTRSWLSTDPLTGLKNASGQDYVTASNLPSDNPDYTAGKVTWADWKPITGENAWAFLIGPLQASYLNFVVEKKQAYVPFTTQAVQNAINVLPAFKAMQSSIGGIYYAPKGTYGNTGTEPVNQYEVSVENNMSLYGGLNILKGTLTAELNNETDLTADQKTAINTALETINGMLNGNDQTQGLISFFKNYAWKDGEFIQGGLADEPGKPAWQPTLEPKAVDVNTWGIAAIGPETVDSWFGKGAAYGAWQHVKSWGGYGEGKTLWGVGYSDQDGNGIDPATGEYKQGIMSTEWTAGAINAVRVMAQYYGSAYPDLNTDLDNMTANVQKLQVSAYSTAGFPGTPDNYNSLMSTESFQPYLYSSKRYMIPFGWYANPLPSTCSTAWMIMVADGFNPFVYGGDLQK